jgi:hypothetical protein
MHGSRVGKEFHAPALLDTMRPSATSALLRIASYTSTACRRRRPPRRPRA